MDNTNKVALTLGFGALGTVLAYYGYNQINDDEEPSKESQEIDEVIKNADNNSKKTTDNGENVVKTETGDGKAVKSETETSDGKAVKGETETGDGKAVKSETEKEISQVKNQWSQYWENEYSQETNDKENIAVL
jgi:hypothetical protein